MKALKTAFTLVFILGLAYYFFLFPLPTVCDSITGYRIGTVDNRFNLSETEFQNDISQAVSAWEKVVGKKLFDYDPNAQLTVNLVFDERQSLSEEIQNTEKQTLEGKKQLQSELEEYKRRSAEFDEHLSVLNSQIEGWNKQGGAPPEEYKRLKEEEDSLKREADELNAMASRLNINVDDYNSKVNKLNQTENSLYNVLLTKPEAGIYDPTENRIDIYFNVSRDELLHTIEHEFGHVLGLGHIDSPTAIMFSRSSQVTTPSEEDVSQLKNHCKKRTLFDYTRVVIKSKLSVI